MILYGWNSLSASISIARFSKYSLSRFGCVSFLPWDSDLCDSECTRCVRQKALTQSLNIWIAWARGLSRLKENTLTVIIDGMDQTRLLWAKEIANFPKLLRLFHLTGSQWPITTISYRPAVGCLCHVARRAFVISGAVFCTVVGLNKDVIMVYRYSKVYNLLMTESLLLGNTHQTAPARARDWVFTLRLQNLTCPKRATASPAFLTSMVSQGFFHWWKNCQHML